MQPMKKNMEILYFWGVLYFTWIGAVPLTEKQVLSKGFHSKGLESRILQGKIADSRQFPWQAGIFNGTVAFDNFWCGGSLINKQWILTAAHCVLGVKPVVFLGSTSLLGDPTGSRQEFSISKDSRYFRMHPQIYFPQDRADLPKNDIALLKLPSPVEFNQNNRDFIKTIELYNAELPSGSEVVASGWGKWEGGEPSNDLRFAKMITINKCNRTTEYICTKGMPQTSHRDSGGPLVVYKNKKPLLAGVTNVGFNPFDNEGPSLYVFFVSVKKHMKWIKATMKRHFH